MASFIGIDTSNYTTSAAIFSETEGLFSEKKLLPVKEGCLGLRQSDAVFEHVRQFPEVFDRLPQDLFRDVKGIGVSVKPSEQEGSYMPCFLSGISVAESLAHAFSVPLFRFSHQAGHLMAALYSGDCTGWMKDRFLAFHVSGGTTDLLLVEPGKNAPFSITRIGGSNDLKMGQAVDRLGVKLGLSFPAGKQLDELSEHGTRKYLIRPSVKGLECSLSGVENHYNDWLGEGAAPADVACSFFYALADVLYALAVAARNEYGSMPILFSGGVMANRIIRASLAERLDIVRFAEPQYSSDNAAGTALLSYYSYQGDL